jgi:hypothetical protein
VSEPARSRFEADFSCRIHKIGGNILAAAACSETSQYFLCDQTENTSKASGLALRGEPRIRKL